jgi:hypothetical protein
MMPVARGRLSHLGDERRAIAQDEPMELAVAVELALQYFGFDSVAMASVAHDRSLGGRAKSEQAAHTEHSFVARDSYLYRGPIGHGVNKRNDSARRKVQVLELRTCFEKC